MPPKQYTEREIIEGCAQNKRLFQEILYRRHFPKMLLLCHRYTKDREVAMEILNTGFLRVFKKVHTFQFKGSFEGWVRKLVFHSISDYFRKNSKYAEMIIFEEKERSTEAAAVNRLYVEDLLKLVNKLPPATSQVFKLYAIEGFTHKEIGEKLNISAGTSKWHLSAAREKLKLMLKHHGFMDAYER